MSMVVSILTVAPYMLASPSQASLPSDKWAPSKMSGNATANVSSRYTFN